MVNVILYHSNGFVFRCKEIAGVISEIKTLFSQLKHFTDVTVIFLSELGCSIIMFLGIAL
jgi:hypothetical protein